MGQEFLVEEQIEAGENFINEFNKYKPVSLACWVKLTESNSLVLYIASDAIDDTNFDIAYGEVLRLLKDQEKQWLDPFQIRLENSSDKFSSDALRIRERYHNTTIATRYNGSSIGGKGIDGAYIYPPIVATKTTA